MMGLGLNIVVGFAGLLDLGYVAFYAIGAYDGRFDLARAGPLT
jgi:branched-chain amino acid transport system permease protein